MRYWLTQIGRAASRLLNAALGGEGDCTFSAWSWELKRRADAIDLESVHGEWQAFRAIALILWAESRVRFVDWLWFNGPGHCRRAWDWHMAHDLIRRDD